MRRSKLSTVVWIGFLLFLVSPFNCFAGMAPVPGFVMLIDVNLSDSTPNIQKLVLQPGAFNDMRMKAPSGNIPGFRLVVLGHDGSSLYEMEFYFPVSITIPPAPPEGPGDQLPSVIPLHNPKVTLIVPYFEDAGTILIMNPGDPKPAAIKSMSDAERETGKDTFPAPQPAPAETGKMNLLIMASGYDSGSFGAFQSQAGVIKSAILGTAPFGGQASKINVHIYANTNNLGCYTGCSGIDRLLCCDSPKVISAASTSGFLFDEIIVVHNTAIYSGGGYRENMNAYTTNSYTTYNVVYDGYYTASMALHEFGHSFGNLCDEYSYGSEGYTYTPCVNCMASCSQYPSVSACQLGCDAEPGYYRPDTSIMYSLSNPVFNDASILADYSPDGLKKRLNFFTYLFPSWNAYLDIVQKTFIGYYQRSADPAGLIYWADRLDRSGGNPTDIIEAFSNSAESQTLYGTINSSTIVSVIDDIYNALFGRNAEPGGLNYFVNGFNSGQFTPATIMLNVLNGAQNEDLQSVNNKLTAANLFTRTIDPELDGSNFRVTYAGAGDVIAARGFLDSVTWNPVTIPTQAQTTAYIKANIADPGDAIFE